MQKCNRSCTLASRNESPGSGQGLQRTASLCQALHLGNLPSQYCTVSLQLSGTDLYLHHRSITIRAAQPWEKPKVPWRCSPGGSASQWAGPSSNSSKVGLCQFAPWPSWPQQPQTKLAEATIQASSCTGKGMEPGSLQGQPPAAVASSDPVLKLQRGLWSECCLTFVLPWHHGRCFRKVKKERGNPAPLSYCKWKRAELIQTKLQTETPPRQRHFSVKFQPWENFYSRAINPWNRG